MPAKAHSMACFKVQVCEPFFELAIKQTLCHLGTFIINKLHHGCTIQEKVVAESQLSIVITTYLNQTGDKADKRL